MTSSPCLAPLRLHQGIRRISVCVRLTNPSTSCNNLTFCATHLHANVSGNMRVGLRRQFNTFQAGAVDLDPIRPKVHDDAMPSLNSVIRCRHWQWSSYVKVSRLLNVGVAWYQCLHNVVHYSFLRCCLDSNDHSESHIRDERHQHNLCWPRKWSSRNRWRKLTKREHLPAHHLPRWRPQCIHRSCSHCRRRRYL